MLYLLSILTWPFKDNEQSLSPFIQPSWPYGTGSSSEVPKLLGEPKPQPPAMCMSGGMDWSPTESNKPFIIVNAMDSFNLLAQLDHWCLIFHVHTDSAIQHRGFLEAPTKQANKMAELSTWRLEYSWETSSYRVGEVGHWSRALAALVERKSLCPKTHTGQFIYAYNSNSRRSNTVFWPLWAWTHIAQTHGHENQNRVNLL